MMMIPFNCSYRNHLEAYKDNSDNIILQGNSEIIVKLIRLRNYSAVNILLIINSMRMKIVVSGPLAFPPCKSQMQDKLALSNRDDKRVWFDKTSSRAIKPHQEHADIGETNK
jgi:hypothetical protein